MQRKYFYFFILKTLFKIFTFIFAAFFMTKTLLLLLLFFFFF